jgi:hypothetical protein
MIKYNAQDIADLLNKVDDKQQMCALDFDEADCDRFNNLVGEILNRSVVIVFEQIGIIQNHDGGMWTIAHNSGVTECIQRFKALANEYTSNRG